MILSKTFTQFLIQCSIDFFLSSSSLQGNNQSHRLALFMIWAREVGPNLNVNQL